MSDIDARITALEQQLDELRRQRVDDRRLGPQPETQEDVDRRAAATNALVDAVKSAVPEVDRSNVCTTNKKPVAEVLASQTNETGQHAGYIVLCETERAKGFVRPYRDAYKHVGFPSTRGTGGCGTVTTMGRALSETYARDPGFYGATFCCGCNRHLPVAEFVWTADGQRVGS